MYCIYQCTKEITHRNSWGDGQGGKLVMFAFSKLLEKLLCKVLWKEISVSLKAYEWQQRVLRFNKFFKYKTLNPHDFAIFLILNQKTGHFIFSCCVLPVLDVATPHIYPFFLLPGLPENAISVAVLQARSNRFLVFLSFWQSSRCHCLNRFI
jgi:hypothetical protein